MAKSFLPAGSTSDITQVVTTGNIIATHNNGGNPSVISNILETVTTISGITNGFQLENEDGSTNDLTFEFNNTTPSNPLLDIKLDGTTQSSIPLNSYDVNIQTTGGLTFNPTTDEITITETDGELHVLDLTPLRTTVTSTDTSIGITQSVNADGSTNYDLSAPTGSLSFSTAPATFPASPTENDTHIVTDTGASGGVVTEIHKYDADTSTWVEVPLGAQCPAPMTRAALIALRTAGGLLTECHYVITDPEANGTLTAQSIILHAVDANTLSMQAGIKTSYDTLAWQGIYDIDTNDVLEVTDNLENKVISNASIINFPFGVAAVNGNTVLSRSNLIYTAGNFINNTIDSDATVTVVNGNVNRNHFKSLSNTTVNSGDFRDNEIGQDATVVSSTNGDIDFNVFGNLSNSTFSGASNFDNSIVNTDANITMTGGSVVDCKFEQSSNYIMSGGVLRRSTVGQDADVTIISQDNYDNVFGASTVYTQVGTGYIRYSTIEGTTSWINGNTNVSNVSSYVSTVNTTGSGGTISNSLLNRVLATNMQNITSLTITDSNISDYAQINATGAARLYIYRSRVSSGRILVSAGTTLNMSYDDIDSYGYVNVTNGILNFNYSKISSGSYIQNSSSGTNSASYNTITSLSNIRFLGTSTGCQISYSSASDGSSIYHNGTSTNSYIYYCNANANSSIYTNNSINARIYYNAAQRGIIYSQANTTTHYIYYCNANSSGQIIMINNTASVRMYSINASSQSIARLQNSTVAANWYYSDFDSYYYAYVTFTTTGTRSGFFGKGRRTNTITNPTLQGIGNLNTQTYLDNF